MKAAPKFRNRVTRELRNGCVTNHPVEKAVTLLQAKRPVEPERLPVVPGLTGDSALVYEHTKPQTRHVSTLLEYFAALRLIMGTYAYCGSHVVVSRKTGNKVKFFTWGATLGYADTALHKVLEIAIPEHAKLAWIRKRDERTRGEMAHLINDGASGDEALAEAMENTVTSGTWRTSPRRRTSTPEDLQLLHRGHGHHAVPHRPARASQEAKEQVSASTRASRWRSMTVRGRRSAEPSTARKVAVRSTFAPGSRGTAATWWALTGKPAKAGSATLSIRP